MIRIVFAATNSAKKTMTAATISPAIAAPSFRNQRRGALDLHDLHLRALLDDLVLEIGPGRPDLSLEADRAAVAVDRLDHGGLLADERRGAGPQLRRHRQVALGDRPDEAERDRRNGQEDRELDAAGDADQRADGGGEGADGKWRQEEGAAA